MLYLTKKVHFSASHTLKSGAFRGHNYVLEVTLLRTPGERGEASFEFEELTEAIEKKILSQVNCKHLDEKTAENLVKIFWNNLETAFPKGVLYEIRLQKAECETVSYRGEP